MKDSAIINDPRAESGERIEALMALEKSNAGSITGEKGQAITGKGEVNNHIHTIYSFSPYTPAMAAARARDAGLEAAGSVDHDSIAAAREMIAACAILGIGGCSGFEIRVSFRGKGPFAQRKINNPDSCGIAYMTVQGVPAPAIPAAEAFLKPIREERLRRTAAMTEKANVILEEAGFAAVDFERDVIGASLFGSGGEITERHLMAAAASKITDALGRGPRLCGGLKERLGIEAGKKTEQYLADPDNPHYLYDLLGVLKTGFLPRFFIQPGDAECVSVKRAVNFALSIEAIPAYAYLGDVGESPTGDKKAEKFEDDFLEELFEELARIGCKAVTYMPPRNTVGQLRKVKRLCAEKGFMEISGVDINSSRQSFNCPEVLQDEFRHLIDTTWALIAHERLASLDPACGLFSQSGPLASMELSQRTAVYAAAGKALDLKRPEESAAAAIEDLRKGRYPS
ncbi:MAG: PHP domain-containing protein [Treponema sp.]|jgi:hypothetical protein|nr:PHP domain-containing protein [Treponema sp.]